MENVYSILHVHRIQERSLKPPPKPTLKIEHHTNNNKNDREAGPRVPSLENWGRRLNSLLWAQLSLHTRCPNLPYTQSQNRRRLCTENGIKTVSRKIECLRGIKKLIEKLASTKVQNPRWPSDIRSQLCHNSHVALGPRQQVIRVDLVVM